MRAALGWPAAALLCVLASGCKPAVEVVQAAPAPALRPQASIQDLMLALVDPHADAIWEAVSTESTLAGTVEHQPRTNAEWLAVRLHAVALGEAANLLQIEGRAVTHDSRKVEDAHVPGILAAPAIQQTIDGSRPKFAERARALQDAANLALLAIDAKDPAQLLVAGARIDQACERCHATYWYPGAAQPVWPAPIAIPAKAGNHTP